MRICLSLFFLAALASARTEFWAPATPPRAHYSIDLKFVPDTSRLEGTAIVRFRNDTRRPIGRIALRWIGDIRVKADGAAVERAPGKHNVPLFDLPRAVPPGGRVELSIEYASSWRLNPKTGSAITSYLCPRLWWGFGTLDDYEVRLHVPDGYAAATSAPFDAKARAYKASGIRAFGLFVGKDYETAEADAGGVHIRAVFARAGRPCAELLLKTAVDVIGFYRQRFGFYPHRSLSIVPGMDYPAGGYPAASALVVVHGQHRMKERNEAFWRWITAHEIGHMYWGDHVLTQGSGSLSWLMIGLGIHADREYRRARAITGAGNLEVNYVGGVGKGRDTTMDVTDEQESDIAWDFNNIVIHGKSAAMLNALESVIGAGTFDRLYRRCLKEYAGRQLGWREFQRIAELESEQDLGWFFDQWVRSSRSANYRVASRDCAPAGEGFDCRLQLERTGDMWMPVTVVARFEDGSEQRARTEWLADTDEVTFRAKTPLKEVVLDPESAFSLVEAPLTARKLRAKIRQMPWTGAGEEALEAYRQAKELKLTDDGARFKLALMLYDGRYYEPALEVMKQLEEGDNRFGALTWQGHLLDLLGRRPEALSRYQDALKVPGSPNMTHSQYNLKIDKAWIEERLKTPFERK